MDNASTDGTTSPHRRRLPAVQLVANTQKNRGFAAANNQVLPHCQGRYLLFSTPTPCCKTDV